jgi:xanthine dehydrogenase YagR molybdenum-binding subunit
MRVKKMCNMPRVNADLNKISVPPLATRFIPMQSDDIVHEGQPVAIVVAESLEAADRVRRPKEGQLFDAECARVQQG